MQGIEETRRRLLEIPEAADLLATLFAHAPFAIQVYEASGRSILHNQAFADLFGSVPPADYNVLRDDIAERNGVLSLIHRAFAGEVVTVPPVWYDPRELQQVQVTEGRRVAVEASLFPLRDAAGSIAHVAIVFRDRSAELVAREQAEAERRQLAEEARTNTALHRIGRVLAAERDHDRLLDRITDEATRLIGAEFGAFFYSVADPHGESFMLYTLAGVDRSHFASFPMPRNTAVFAPTFAGTGIVRSNDITEDPRYGRNAPYQGMPEGHLPVRSYLAVPVVGRSGRVHGGLFFGHSERGRFREPEERAVAGIADQAAVAIENVRLYHQAETERALLEAVVRHMPGGIVVAEPGGRIRLANEQLAELLGAPPPPLESFAEYEAVLGRPATGGSDPGGHPLARAIRSGIGIRREALAITRPDGTTVEVEVDAVPVRDADGHVVAGVCLLLDQTDRRRAEEDERRRTRHAGLVAEVGVAMSTEATLDRMLRKTCEAVVRHLDAAFARVWTLDATGDTLELRAGAGEPSQLDDAHARVRVGSFKIGLIAEERRPHLTNDLPNDPRASDPAWARREGMIGFGGYPLVVEGRLVGVMAMFARRALDEDVLRALGAIADLVAVGIERKRADEERARLLTQEQALRREAEAANRMMDEFLATVSHELRTPLNAMLGWLRMLRTGGVPGDRSEHAMAVIERNAVTQLRLVEDLLDMSRVMVGNLRLEVAPIQLSRVVEAALESVRPPAEAKSIRIVSVLDSEAGPVAGDATRLQQVAWNLLNNAVKFTPRGGRVQVQVQRADSSVELVVTDTGQGIEPEFLPHVFDRFRQQESGFARAHGGLGLGLAIVKSLVELHGGTVTADSAGAGRGAQFRVRLPIAALSSFPDGGVAAMADAVTAGGPGARPLALEGLRVLVVDDDPDAIEVLVELLRNQGITVATATSAAEGFDALRRERPDVLVSDLGLPGEDGYSLMRRIRALGMDEGGGTPAIALSAHARMEDRTGAFLAGFQVHVAKPIEPRELLAVIANASGRNRPRS